MPRLYSADYYRANSERMAANHHRYYLRNKETIKQRNADNRRKLRRAALDAYGSACACCGSTQDEFLSIDHVNTDGAEHRKKIGLGSAIHQWLRREDYPEGFQVLCFNCNMSKGLYGQCPHLKT